MWAGGLMSQERVRARPIRMRTMGGAGVSASSRLPIAGLLVWVVAGLTGCEAVREQPISAEARAEALAEATEIERSFFDAVNREREQRETPALAWTPDLLEAAREHSRRMGEKNFFSHEDPELGSLPARLRRHKVRATAAGENLFMSRGMADPVGVAVEGWLNSPQHRHNMLHGEFTETAVGAYRTATGAVYITQLFRRPSRLPIPLRQLGETPQPQEVKPAPRPAPAPEPEQ
jgi:uncharacterized protein YkwD